MKKHLLISTLLVLSLTATFSSCTKKSFLNSDSSKKNPDGKGGLEGTQPDSSSPRNEFDAATNLDAKNDDEISINEDEFKAFQKIKKKIESDQKNNDDENGPNGKSSSGTLSSNNLLVKDFQAQKKVHFYIVTTKGNVYYIVLNGKNVNKDKSKSFKFKFSGNGSRTYVTEGGLVFTNNDGVVYWVDPQKYKDNANLDTINGARWKIPGANDRVCVVSYQNKGERFLGFSHGKGSFTAIKLAEKKPYAPIWRVVHRKSFNVNINKFGYSCYIDQNEGIMYSQSDGQQGAALNIRSLKAVTPKAPNKSFKSNDQDIANATQGLWGSSVSYSMSGDSKGNIFNGKDFYTFAKDPKHDVIWASHDNGTMMIFPEECLTKNANCKKSEPFSWNASKDIGASLGPLSTIPNHGVIGLVRDAGDAYFLEWDNKKKDVIFERLDIDVEGDPYMYNDFTGSSLYSRTGGLDYNLNQGKNFDEKEKVKLLAVRWYSKKKSKRAWRNMKLEIRCYATGQPPPKFIEVRDVQDADKDTLILAKTCRRKKVDQAELQITQEGDGTDVDNIEKIEIIFVQ